MAGLIAMTHWTLRYILEELTVGQVVYFYSSCAEHLYGKPKDVADKPTKDLTADELRAERERLRALYGDDVEGM